MPRQHDVRFKLCSTANRRIKIVHLKPQKYTISGLDVGISDTAVMVLYIPVVQLQDKSSLANETLILRPSVVTMAAKQTLIPATARLDIADANQWLGIHSVFEARRLYKWLGSEVEPQE